MTAVADLFRSEPTPEGQLTVRARRRQRLALLVCRSGLHFLGWDQQWDAYTCRCHRINLYTEEIR